MELFNENFTWSKLLCDRAKTLLTVEWASSTVAFALLCKDVRRMKSYFFLTDIFTLGSGIQTVPMWNQCSIYLPIISRHSFWETFSFVRYKNYIIFAIYFYVASYYWSILCFIMLCGLKSVRMEGGFFVFYHSCVCEDLCFYFVFLNWEMYSCKALRVT